MLAPADLASVVAQAEAAEPGDGLRSADALMSAANAMANMRVLESGFKIKCVCLFYSKLLCDGCHSKANRDTWHLELSCGRHCHVLHSVISFLLVTFQGAACVEAGARSWQPGHCQLPHGQLAARAGTQRVQHHLRHLLQGVQEHNDSLAFSLSEGMASHHLKTASMTVIKVIQNARFTIADRVIRLDQAHAAGAR